MPRGLDLVLCCSLLVLAACGPSAEELAATNTALTAAAATPIPAPTDTPLPTPTPTLTPSPTPIPYDLSVSVTDADGNPIPGAQVALAELGDDPAAVQTADEGGAVAWGNLPGEAVSLAVSAQGYFATEQTTTLERGPNEVTITLERDPLGLLPSAACAPGETLLYVEDFQDGLAQGWPEIAFGAQGWSIGPDTADAANTLVIAQGEGAVRPFLSAEDDSYVFDNAVWRLRFQISGQAELVFNWHQNFGPLDVAGVQGEDTRYGVFFHMGGGGEMQRLQIPALTIPVARWWQTATPGTWHFLEVSTYDGVTSVWMDGQELAAYEDPQPLPGGILGLEPYPANADSAVYYDDISVCELSGPFVPMPTPAPEG